MANRKDNEGRILPENVIQRKDGTYMWKKTISGRQYCEYSKTLNGIKQKRNEALYKIQNGTYKTKKERTKEQKIQAEKDITLNEWFFKWEKAYRVGKVKNNTLQHNHRTYMSHFSNTIGTRKIKDIKQIDLVTLYQEMKARGLSSTTVHRYSMILLNLFTTAVDNGLISINPAQGALHIRREEINKMERRVLTAQEQERFLEYVKRDDYFRKYYSFFVVAFNTGMRVGEITALTWSDIDFENRVIDINHAMSYQKNYVENKKSEMLIDTPKTRASIRVIPMVKEVYRELQYVKQYGKKSTCIINGYKDFVFVTSTGVPYLSSNIGKSIKAIVDKMNDREAELARREEREPEYFEQFSPHSIRHSFATRCFEKDIKPKVVQKLLGHSSIQMTMDLYVHVTEDTKIAEICKLEN